MALTLERSFFCTGDTCYLLDDTQPASEPELGSLQSDPPATPSSSPPSLPHTSSLSPAPREPAPTPSPLASSEPASLSPLDLESYLHGVSGVRWRVDEFDWVYGSRVVRATKIDTGGALAAASGTLQDPLSPDDPDGDGPRDSGGDRPLQSPTIAPPRGRRGNTLSLRLPRYSSVVMKHAPLVFNEVLGMLLDPYRQTIEAKVLTALYDTTSPLYPITASCKDVLIPELIHHALSPNLLVKTDLGEYPSMDRFISSPSFTHPRGKILGLSLGDFLGKLHSAVSFVGENQPKPTARLRRLLINSYTEPTIQAVLGTTGAYLRMAGVKDHENLLKMASERWLGREKSAFCKGNISFGTLQVISKDSDEDPEDDQIKVILCDWEFAGPNHPAVDLAQMGAYLHLASLSPLADGQRRAAVATFANGLYKTYYSHLCSITDDVDRYRRSLLVLHACEMITASVWKHTLWCDCEGVLLCSHTRITIHMAAGLLRSVKEQRVDWLEAERVSSWTRYLRGILEESGTVAS